MNTLRAFAASCLLPLLSPSPAAADDLYAEVLSGQVTAVHLWDGVRPISISPGALLVLTRGVPASKGWTYSNNTFLSPNPPYTPTPSMSKRQLLQWLGNNTNKTVEDIRAVLVAVTDKPTRVAFLAFWDAPDRSLLRSDPLVNTVGEALGLTPTQLDNLFEQASHL